MTSIFINEIHYDNVGADAGEAIEIAAPAGTDLTGWSLVLYDGSDGTVYDTEALSGVVSDQGDGFGKSVINFPSEGLQDGATTADTQADGIALVDDESGVIQFLSYEGVLTAVGGPADGLTSTDIGVAEDETTLVGSSLQLTGTGSTAQDFTWTGPVTSTFGSVNAGQTFTATAPDAEIVHSIAVDQATVVEGDTGFQDVTFTITRTGAIAGSSQVGYTITGDATLMEDFEGIGGSSGATELTGTVPFAADEPSKTIELRVLGDVAVESDETIIVTLENPTADPGFDAVLDAVSGATTTITDDDTAGFTITPPETTTLQESETVDFSIELSVQPATSVELSVISSNPTAATVAPATLTFDATDWDVPQTVTITGTNDSIVNAAPETADITVSVVPANSDDAFDSVENQLVNVTTTDNDIVHSVAVDLATVPEGDAGSQPVTFTITRTGATTGSSSVNYAITGEAELDADFGAIAGTSGATGLTGTVTFAADEDSKTVTLDVLGDLAVEAAETIILTLSDPTAEEGFEASLDDMAVAATTTITDDDTAALTVTLDTPTVNEGETGTLTVSLATQPTENVVVDVVSTNPAEATVSAVPSLPLTFTPANWDVGQTVAIAGIDDEIADGAQDTDITVSVVEGSSDAAFAELSETVTVNVADNDTAEFILTPPDAVILQESETADFTVELSVQPATPVELSVASSNPTAATVAPETLTFDATDWDVPQTVTITGTNDSTVDAAPETADITVSVVPANSDDAFDSVENQLVNVTTTDNDIVYSVAVTPETVTEGAAGEQSVTFTITRTGATTGSSSVNYAIAGDAELGTDFAIAPTSGITELTGTLNFATDELSKTITLDIQDDLTVEEAETIILTLSEPTAGEGFEATLDATATTATTTIEDNDIGGLTVSAETITVSEALTTDTFNVSLTSQPTEDVVVSVVSADLEEATVSAVPPLPLVFTSANWDEPQTVTVTGVDDEIADGPQETAVTVSVVNASSDPAFADLSDTVTVTTTDNDMPGFTILPPDAITVQESETATFTVELNVQPTAPVELSVTSTNLDAATVAPETLTFDETDWDVPQTVTVTGANDLVVDEDETGTITVSVEDASSDAAFGMVEDQTVEVTTTDNDITYSLALDNASVSEGAPGEQTATFTITRSGAIAGSSEVSYAITGEAELGTDFAIAPTSDATDLTGTLSFAADETSKTITVNVQDDSAVEAEETIILTLSDPTAETGFEASLDTTATTATTTITDNDAAGLVVSRDTVSLGEGFTETVTVSLESQPTTSVVVSVESDNPDEATATPAELTFTAANWETDQSITVTAVDDEVADGNQDVVVTVSVVDATSDEAFAGLSDTFTVTTTDNDSPGFTITPTSLEVDEAGETATFTVDLNTQPTGEVTLPLSLSDPAQAELTPTSLTFNSTDWDQPQTVTVTGLDDELQDGDQTITVETGDPTSTDPAYNGATANPVDVSVTVLDDDTAGFVVTPTSGLTLSEAGGTATFEVVLTAVPSDPVTLPLSVSDGSEASIDLTELIFDATNWDVPQTVTITGLDDDVSDGDQLITIVTGDPVSDDPSYNGIINNPPDVTATVTDDESPVEPIEGGFTLSPTELTVSEQGTSDTFTVVLDSQPTTDVVLQVESQDTTEATTSPVALTFTPVDWNQPQTVTVTGVDDDISDGSVTSQVTVSVIPAQSDDAFDALSPQGVTVTTTDDDDDVLLPVPQFGADLDLDTNPPTISGTAIPGTTVEILRGDEVLGTVEVDGSGNFEFTPAEPLPEGDYNLTLRATDSLGNTSELSEPLTFTISDVLPGGDPTEADDDITGTDDRDVIFAGAGDDIVQGQGGNDRLAGEDGNDRLLGGEGNDRLLGLADNDTLIGGPGDDRILGGDGNDRLVGNAGNERLVGGAGEDDLLGGVGNDIMIGGEDDDRLLGAGGRDLMRGNLGDDLLNGGADNDRLFGGPGNDRLNGQGGDDVLRGGDGQDVLRGGVGDDRLIGGAGNDFLFTGDGRDRIVISPGEGFDRVNDFADELDLIVLGGGVQFGDLSIEQQNADVLISFNNEQLLLLQNTNVAQISEADFGIA